ncbi:MAG: Spy/CpxP family protein refolding chaperone [Deltaproteobacteria bacterium]|nr:Spy/CpxP family protein refolding chaperone [Deltaproteobacteria bacterium]
MKKISLIAAFLLLVASSTWVMAGPRGKAGKGGGGWCPGASLLSTLNLSAEQSEKVRALRESFLKETTPIRTQMFTKRAEVKLLWLQTNLDAAKIRATQKEIRDLIGQLQEKRTDFRLAFRNLLTPEQTTRLLAQGVGRGMGSKWGRGPGGGPGRGPGNWR